MNKKLLLVVAASFIILLLVASCGGGEVCAPRNIEVVDVTLTPQHRDWWCWAATTEMITEFYGHEIDQCESANFKHGIPPDCCTGCAGDCPGWGVDWGASLANIEDNWQEPRNGGFFEFTHDAFALSWDTLRETIAASCEGSPIQVVWWWYGGGGHVVTAYGYSTANDFVHYMNPWPPDCEQDLTTDPPTCLAVAGGEDAISTYAAFVDDNVHNWGNSFHSFSYESACAGDKVGGHCWYLGPKNVSCNTVCADHGGYDEATKTYAGSDGSSDNCRSVLETFGLQIDEFYDTTQGGIGCFAIQNTSGNYFGYRDSQETTADALSVTPGRMRACACNE